MNDKQKAVIDFLNHVAENEHCSNRHGICDTLYARFGIVENIFNVSMYAIFKKWRYFSGDVVYPVPATALKIKYNPFISDKGEYQYRLSHRSDSLWVGKQGKLRRNLCSFIACELEKSLVG